MDDVIAAAIKNVGVGKPSKPIFNKKECLESCVMWLIGGVLALVPVGLKFFMLPVNDLTVATFFGNPEIIYTSITMAIIALCANVRHIGRIPIALFILVIVVGTVVFAVLECGVAIPALNDGGLCTFNIVLLSLVVIVGLVMFLYACHKNGDGV